MKREWEEDFGEAYTEAAKVRCPACGVAFSIDDEGAFRPLRPGLDRSLGGRLPSVPCPRHAAKAAEEAAEEAKMNWNQNDRSCNCGSGIPWAHCGGSAYCG